MLRRLPKFLTKRWFLLAPLLLALLALLAWPTSLPKPTEAQLQHLRARELLFARPPYSRVSFLHIHKGAGSTVCHAAQLAGELVNAGENCNLAGPSKRALSSGSPAAQCAALRTAPFSFVANERGLSDDPVFPAGVLHVAVLREPLARMLSQYLHVRAAGEAYLRVRAWPGWLAAAPDAGFVRQGKHPKWPAELRAMGVPPQEGVPSLLAMLQGARAGPALAPRSG